jgi:hypothetical protein
LAEHNQEPMVGVVLDFFDGLAAFDQSVEMPLEILVG